MTRRRRHLHSNFGETTEEESGDPVSDISSSSRSRADMSFVLHLNAFISERLSAAAEQIIGAVEKTLIEYQGEISRSKREIDHLRSLLPWPAVKLHRYSASHQASLHYTDEEASPEHCHEEDWAPDVTPDLSGPQEVKEENDQRIDQQGLSCEQQCDTTVSPQLVKTEDHGDPHSHICRSLTVEQTAYVKAELVDGDEFDTSSPNKEADIPESGHQEEHLEEPLETSHHEQRRPDDQQHTEQDWNSCQDHKNPDPPQIKVEKFTSCIPEEETDCDFELPLQPLNSVYNEPHFSRPSHNQTLSNKTLLTGEEKERDADGEGCKLSGLNRLFQSFSPLNPVSQSECCESIEGLLTGEWIKALTQTEVRLKKRQKSDLCSMEKGNIGVEECVNDVTRERRHTCPICAKRFKESSHLKDHLRIHTGEKPYRCKECSMNFRQSGALTLHMRIHTGERPYQCTDCGRRFNRKGDMETHRVTHTGERPHLCMVCGKSFKRKSNLNTHLKIHAQGKMDYVQPL